jgi:hypothetical protein
MEMMLRDTTFDKRTDVMYASPNSNEALFCIQQERKQRGQMCTGTGTGTAQVKTYMRISTRMAHHSASAFHFCICILPCISHTPNICITIRNRKSIAS